MITVYKYTLGNWKKNVCRLILPVGAEILKTAWYDSRQIELWAKVDTTAAEEVCYFYIVKTGENITKRLEQRDKSKKLEFIGDFWDGGDTHWHIFKAVGDTNSVVGHYWDNNGLIKYKGSPTVTPYYTLCGDTATTTISNCCDDMSEGGVTLTNSGSALTISKNDINIVED